MQATAASLLEYAEVLPHILDTPDMLAAASSAVVPFSSQSRVAQRTGDIGEACAFAGMFEFLDQQVDLAQKCNLVER